MIYQDTVIKKKLPSNSSVFTAELLAVLSALKYIFFSSFPGKNFTIFTDSMSILYSLGKLFSCHPIVQEIKDWFYLLVNRRGFTVQFCWVPSHVGIVGNERADVAAKAATRLNHILNMGIPICDFKNSIKFYCREQWQDHWSNLRSNFKLKSIRPSVNPWTHCRMNRRSSIILTRLRIGHTYCTHRYLMASGVERQVPRCSTCQVDLTVEHIMVICPALAIKRRANLLADKPLVDILGEHVPLEQLIKYLKDIDIFYDI